MINKIWKGKRKLMKKLIILFSMIFVLFSLCSCGKETEEYKKEAKYFYEQIGLALQNSDVDEEIQNLDKGTDPLFSERVYDIQVRAICLNNLIHMSPYTTKLNDSYNCLQELFIDSKENQEIKILTESIYSEYNNIIKLLEGSNTEEISQNFQLKIENIEESASKLYEYVKDQESVSHSNAAENEATDVYNEELENIEKDSIEDALGSQDHPLCVGDSVEVNFIDNGAGRKGDSWYVATGKFTYKGSENGVMNLNFELVDQEAENGIVLGPQYGYGFSFNIVNENLQKEHVSYEGSVYRSEDKDEYIAVLKGGNIDFSVKTNDDTSYLVLYYVEPTEENLNVVNLAYSTEKTLWFKLN